MRGPEFSDLIGKSAHRLKRVAKPPVRAFGFDAFDLSEVIPEYTAEVGHEKGEKVDFVIMIDKEPGILIEVKPISMALGNAQFSQLHRYFGVTEARLAVLTNGREIWFFSDIDQPNRMDRKPFLAFDLQSCPDAQIEELSRFRRTNFSVDNIVEAASSLKYISAASEEPALRDGIETTEDERQAFMIIRAIGAKCIPMDRISIRDAKSYCSVFIDDTNRKPIYRFYFNGKSKRYIGVFDRDKTETKTRIDNLEDIFRLSGAIEDCIKSYA